MKRKASIIINIATIALCICAIAIGVYSAKNANMSTTGTVGFNANHCKVQVVGKITGAQIGEAGEKVYYIAEGTNVTPIESTGETIPTGAIIDIDGEDTTTPTKSASFGTLQFANDENWEPKPIVFTFTITNKSNFRITAGISLTNLTMDTHITREANEYMIDLKPTGTTGDSGSITVTFEVKSEQTIDEAITGSMNLEFNKFDANDFEKANITDDNNIPNLFMGDISDIQNSYCIFKFSESEEYGLYHVPVGSGTLKVPPYLYDETTDSLKKVTRLFAAVNRSLGAYTSFDYESSYTTCILPETIVGFGYVGIEDKYESVWTDSNMVFNSTNLKSVNIPRGVEMFSYDNFSTKSLTSITIDGASDDNWAKSEDGGKTYTIINLKISSSEIAELITTGQTNWTLWKKVK